MSEREGFSMKDSDVDALPSSGSDHPARGPDYVRLLSLLEQASAGSRELDATAGRLSGANPIVTTEDKRTRARLDTWLPYTTSLDAALTLYRTKPDRIPTDPLKACAEALRQWH